MYEIVRVGVPARKQDATKSFYDVVDDIKLGFSVGLITSDLNSFEKLSAPYGYNYLKTELSQTIVEENLKYNTLNVFTNIWDIHGGKTPEESIDNLISYFDSQKLKKIYLFTCGSPYVSDMVTNILPLKRTMSIIDCESPIKICSLNMKEFLNLNTYIINYGLNDIIPKVLNVFPGISKYYGINVVSFFEILKTKLSDTDKFLYAEILEDGSSFVKCMSFKDALNDISWFSETEKLLTYGVYKQ